MALKQGANKPEQSKIADYAKKGASAKEISQGMGIALKCVESFMPKGNEKEVAEIAEKEAEAAAEAAKAAKTKAAVAKAAAEKAAKEAEKEDK